MRLCPKAIIDDGLFDINLIEKVGFWKLLRHISKLNDGTYLNYLDCIQKKVKVVEIVSNEYLYSEADGEFLGKDITRFEILEKRLKIYN